MGDFTTQPLDNFGLADVRAILGGRQVVAFRLDASADTSFTGNVAVALDKKVEEVRFGDQPAFACMEMQ